MQIRLFKLLSEILFLSLLVVAKTFGAEDIAENSVRSCEVPTGDVSFYNSEVIPSCWKEEFANFKNCYSLGKGIYPESLEAVYKRIYQRFSKSLLLELEKRKGKQGFRADPLYRCAEKKLCTQSILDSCAFVEFFWLNDVMPFRSVSDFNHELVDIVIDGQGGFEDFKLALSKYVNRLHLISKYSEFSNSEIKECQGESEEVGGIYITRSKDIDKPDKPLPLIPTPLRQCEINKGLVLWLGNLKTKEWIKVPSGIAHKILRKLEKGEDEIVLSDEELAPFLR